MNSEIELLKNQIEEYQEKEKKSEIIFKQSIDFREDLEAYKEKYNSLKAANEAEIVKISSEYETTLHRKAEQLNDNEKKFEELNEKINNLQIENLDLANKHDTLKEHLDKLKSDQESLETSSNIERSNLIEKSAEVDKLSKQLEEKISENEAIKVTFEKELSENSEKYRFKESECEQLLNRLETNTNNYEALLSTHAELKEANGMCSKQLLEKSSQLESIEKLYNDLMTEAQEKENSFKVILYFVSSYINGIKSTRFDFKYISSEIVSIDDDKFTPCCIFYTITYHFIYHVMQLLV